MMNRLIIYIIVLFVTTSGTWIATRFEIKKALKPLKKQLEKLRTDSAKTAIYCQKLRTDFVQKQQDDSINADRIADLQILVQDFSRENRALKAWKLDAEDGVIVKHDTVRVGIFGKVKKRK
jgi:hypothetical protein